MGLECNILTMIVLAVSVRLKKNRFYGEKSGSKFIGN